MKFFKFDVEVFDYDGPRLIRHILETHYLNVEEIKEIIVSSSIGGGQFIVRTRGGGVFYLKNDCLDSLLKLIDIFEMEAKNRTE